jgi:hypothetical protein
VNLAVEYEVLKEGRVLWQVYTDPIDMIEVAAHSTKLQREFFDHATQPIHTVSDFSKVTRLPRNVISGSLSIMRNSHPMMGELILITTNRFVTMMARIFKRSAEKNRITLCRTSEEAWDVINSLLEQEKIAVL